MIDRKESFLAALIFVGVIVAIMLPEVISPSIVAIGSIVIGAIAALLIIKGTK